MKGLRKAGENKTNREPRVFFVETHAHRPHCIATLRVGQLKNLSKLALDKTNHLPTVAATASAAAHGYVVFLGTRTKCSLPFWSPFGHHKRDTLKQDTPTSTFHGINSPSPPETEVQAMHLHKWTWIRELHRKVPGQARRLLSDT